jgi:hypothetical protein
MNIQDLVAQKLYKLSKSVVSAYQDNKIERVSVIGLEQVTLWFHAQQRIHPEASSGLLLRYFAIQEEHNKIRKWAFQGMSKGYIQILLNEEAMIIRDDSGHIVFRYLEAESEAEDLSEKFGDKDVIKFE